MPDSLLEAARALHHVKGARMSVSELAERAGVSRATVYQRLGSKADILALMAQEGGRPDVATDIEGRIFQGLMEIATERGFRAATIDDVATAAGVGPATIYRRYGDKDGLIRSFVASRSPSTATADRLAEASPPAAHLAALIRGLLDYMSEHHALVRLIHSGSAEDRLYVQGFRDAETSTFARITAFFHAQQVGGTLAANIPPQDLATHLFGMLYAHTVLSEGRKPFDADTAHASIMAMFTPLMIGGTS